MTDASTIRAATAQDLPAALKLLHDACRQQAVQEVWLLTIDADPFFEKLGYVVRTRDAAPDVIRGTAEFSSLCPGDAVLMSKELRPLPVPEHLLT